MASQRTIPLAEAIKREDIDVSSVLATLAAEDYVGLRFESDTSNLRVLGLNIKYS